MGRWTMIEDLSPWMLPPIRCAAKMGFLSRTLWNNVMAKGLPSWRNEQWSLLKSRGLFASSSRYDHGDRTLVLTDKGRRAAEELNINSVISPIGDFISHDETAAEFALRLESDGLISSWWSESEIKRDNFKYTGASHTMSRKSKFPDLVIRLAIPGEANLMAVEIEKTRKSNERYNEFVNKYKGLPDIDTVIVLAESKRIIDAIKKAQIRTSFPQHLRPFVFGLINEVMKNPGQATLDFDGKSVSLESAVQSLRTKRNSEIARKTSEGIQNDRQLHRFQNGHKGYPR